MAFQENNHFSKSSFNKNNHKESYCRGGQETHALYGGCRKSKHYVIVYFVIGGNTLSIVKINTKLQDEEKKKQLTVVMSRMCVCVCVL